MVRRVLVGVPTVLLVGLAAAWGYLRQGESADPGFATAAVMRGEIE